MMKQSNHIEVYLKIKILPTQKMYLQLQVPDSLLTHFLLQVNVSPHPLDTCKHEIRQNMQNRDGFMCECEKR